MFLDRPKYVRKFCIDKGVTLDQWKDYTYPLKLLPHALIADRN